MIDRAAQIGQEHAIPNRLAEGDEFALSQALLPTASLAMCGRVTTAPGGH
ncbi:MAG: hypothetical protein R2873_15370 [Caldilineaceae bacterium]